MLPIFDAVDKRDGVALRLHHDLASRRNDDNGARMSKPRTNAAIYAPKNFSTPGYRSVQRPVIMGTHCCWSDDIFSFRLLNRSYNACRYIAGDIVGRRFTGADIFTGA